jgi:osmotically-inducible protein OsmY
LVPAALADAPASAQASPAPARSSPDLIVFQALLANPVTAPYRIGVALRGGQVALSGRVGTKQIHDEAIRTALSTGFSIRDDLTIDTAEAHRVAATASMGMGMGGAGAIPAVGASSYYIYPPPLFARIDEPFFGFEPPVVSYPPWWRSGLSSRSAINPPAPGDAGLAPGVDSSAGAAPPPTGVAPVPVATSLNRGAVEMTIDARGVATLRGTVPTLADRVAIGQRIAQTPGVAEVINLLNIGPPASVSDAPPPPPLPAATRPAKPPANPGPVPDPNAAASPNIEVDRGDLADRLAQSIARRPSLAGLPIKTSLRDGVAYLSGQVPSVYEAMLAFRAAQQTPGVRDVDDRLEFVVPDGERKNPLLQKGRPEDVEPYLAAQVRRQVGDLAHVDQVRLRGDSLEIRGTLVHDQDRPRLEAILRSMPVLRGFRLDPVFVVE